jgi:hypothetical protein
MRLWSDFPTQNNDIRHFDTMDDNKNMTLIITTLIVDLLRATMLNAVIIIISLIGLYHPLDGITNPMYKLLCLLTTKCLLQEKKAIAFNWDRFCHLALCLWLILFHCLSLSVPSTSNICRQACCPLTL